MQDWKPWSVFVALAVLFSAASDASPPAQRSQARPPTQAKKRRPAAPLPSFLDVLLQDEEVLAAHHARFEPPFDVEMAGMKGTVKFSRMGSPVSLAVVAMFKDASSNCEHQWDRVMGALKERFGDSTERHVVVGSLGFRSAVWGPPEGQIRVDCHLSGWNRSGERGRQLAVSRLYSRPSRSELASDAPPPKGHAQPSFVELLLEDASAFLRWDGTGHHGSKVDLAGSTGRVEVEWFGDSGDTIWVTVRPEPGVLTACEPLWGRIVGQLSKRLGASESPVTASTREGNLRASWAGISADCFERRTSGGVTYPASLSVTRYFPSLPPDRDGSAEGDSAQASRSPPAPAPRAGKPTAKPKAGPPFLDVLLQDAAALSRSHARFEAPLKVDLAGTKGTVRFVRASERAFSVLAEPDQTPATCSDLWGSVMDALRARRGEASILRITVSASGRRSARFGPRGEPMIDVHCSDSSQAPPGRGGWATEFKVVRHYRFTPEPEAAPPSKAPASPPPGSTSFVDLLLKDAYAFHRWDEQGLHGSTVDLAGIAGRVSVEWYGPWPRLAVTVRPASGPLQACEPHWRRLFDQLSARLGAPAPAVAAASKRDGKPRARWDLRSRSIYAECTEQKTSNGFPTSAALRVTNEFR